MTMRKRMLITLILTAILLPAANGAPASFKDIVEQVNPAVVYIEITKQVQSRFDIWGRRAPQDVTGSGSGVIIDAANGYVLTAAHVIDGVDSATIHLLDGRKFEAVEFLSDTQTDVGIVKIEIPEGELLPQVAMGSSEELAVGDWVLAMGSPLGRALANSVSAGIVSGKGRKSGILGQLGIEDFIQTDAVINKGNSGGPLVNMKGEIIGINSNIISATGLSSGLGFAVPSDLAKGVVERLIADGVVVRGYLGVSVTSFDSLKDEVLDKLGADVIAAGGAYIVQVVEGGPGDEAGLKDGDIITEVDGEKIADSAALIRYISSKMPDEKVSCRIIRDGKETKVKVTLGIRPGTGGTGATAVVTSRDKATAAYKKLGIVVDDYTEQQSDSPFGGILEAVKIRTVSGGSIAEEFGLKDGDIIVEVDGERIKNSNEFNKAVEKVKIKDGVLLNVRTDGNFRKVFLKQF